MFKKFWAPEAALGFETSSTLSLGGDFHDHRQPKMITGPHLEPAARGSWLAPRPAPSMQRSEP